MPAAPFNATVWPASVTPSSTNAEIVRVTAVVGDTLTIVRAQEGTSARTIVVGDQFANTVTAKVFTDIEAASGGGGAAISAGANSQNTGTVVFANSNGVTFGLSNNGSLTASYTVPSTAGLISAINFSAGTTSNNLSAITFSNSNGVSFGLSGSVVTANHNGITSQTVQTQSNVQGISAGTQVGRTGDIQFVNSNGISFGMSNSSQVTASYTVPSTAGLLSAINFSAGTTSNNLSAITFSNSNGVTFGLNGSVVTASYTVPGATVFSNSNNVTFGLNGSTVTASASVASTQASINFSAGTTSNNSSAIKFADSNGVSFGLNLGTITATIATSLTNVRISAGTASNNLSALTFDNAGGITFGLNGSVITAAAPAGAPSPVNFSAGTTSNNLGSVVFSNSNGISFGLNGSTITASGGGGITALNFSAGAASANISDSLVFSNSNNVQFGLNGSTITAKVLPDYMSSYENYPGIFASSLMTFGATSLSHAVAFFAPEDISASYLRMPILMTTNSTTIATMASATATASGALYHTFNAVMYSMGTGASSQSLQSVVSGSAQFTFSQNISITNSTQASYSLGMSAYALGAGTTLTTQYSVSNTNYSFTTNAFTAFSSARMLDIPFANSISEGPYWLIVGNSSSSASGGAAGLAALTNCNVRYSGHYGASQMNIGFGVMGSTNLTSVLLGAGSFSTAGGGTTNSLNISQISSMASNPRLYFQLIRQA